MTLTDDLRDHLAGIEPELVALRRDLHQVPELGLHLPQTQARLLQELDGIDGIEVTLGESLSSIVVVLRGAAPASGERRAVLLRGDMDALPVTEQTGLPYASTNGAMHACGHDLHMSLVMGALKSLAAHRDRLPGDVVFMFQPGEEGQDGASHMIREGVLDAAGRRVDAAFAIHVFSALEPHGTVACRGGAIMAASDDIDVTVTGRGGHGSAPHLAADPVPALAEMVLATQVLVARHVDIFDPAVITVGHLTAGTARNVIPESGSFRATMRTFSVDQQDRLFQLVPQTLQGIAAAHGVTADVRVEHFYPVTVNDADQATLVLDTCRELFGEDRGVRWERPLTGSEDFSRVLQEVPGAFIALSAVPPGVDHRTSAYNHSAYATFDDDVVTDGALLLATLAVRTLGA